jgi:hypothetical protein
MTHAALTPLLGREFDNFLFASIGDDRDGPVLSVVSVLARLDVDPWKEAIDLARMPKHLAADRLASLIASLPQGSTAAVAPEAIAGRLVALLPQAYVFKAHAPAARGLAVSARPSRLFIGLSALALLAIAALAYSARTSHTPGRGADVPAQQSEPARRQ